MKVYVVSADGMVLGVFKAICTILHEFEIYSEEEMYDQGYIIEVFYLDD